MSTIFLDVGVGVAILWLCLGIVASTLQERSDTKEEGEMAEGVGRMELQPVRMSGSGTVGAAFASTAAAFEAPDRQAAILALEPQFEALAPAILHTIVEGVEPAGPHVGNPDFPEGMLKELGRYVQERREQKQLKREARISRAWTLAERAAIAIISFVLGILAG